MKLKTNYNKITSLRTRYLSSKAVAIFVINRKLKSIFEKNQTHGKLTDIQLNRVEKKLTLELIQKQGSSTITVDGYTFITRKGEPYLTWKSIDFSGPATDQYQAIFQKKDGIEISKRYISLVKALL